MKPHPECDVCAAAKRAQRMRKVACTIGALKRQEVQRQDFEAASDFEFAERLLVERSAELQAAVDDAAKAPGWEPA